ncbi:hypothetical protein B0H14DRAFT_2637481 [Mycena olivaceomarginata]|nr:hypothetical protein B0H14DRAFT_2637481 [Mycena olivaceomarginata]
MPFLDLTRFQTHCSVPDSLGRGLAADRGQEPEMTRNKATPLMFSFFPESEHWKVFLEDVLAEICGTINFRNTEGLLLQDNNGILANRHMFFEYTGFEIVPPNLTLLHQCLVQRLGDTTLPSRLPKKPDLLLLRRPTRRRERSDPGGSGSRDARRKARVRRTGYRSTGRRMDVIYLPIVPVAKWGRRPGIRKASTRATMFYDKQDAIRDCAGAR